MKSLSRRVQRLEAYFAPDEPEGVWMQVLEAATGRVIEELPYPFGPRGRHGQGPNYEHYSAPARSSCRTRNQ
jgi:hypothetical protein